MCWFSYPHDNFLHEVSLALSSSRRNQGLSGKWSTTWFLSGLEGAWFHMDWSLGALVRLRLTGPKVGASRIPFFGREQQLRGNCPFFGGSIFYCYSDKEFSPWNIMIPTEDFYKVVLIPILTEVFFLHMLNSTNLNPLRHANPLKHRTSAKSKSAASCRSSASERLVSRNLECVKNVAMNTIVYWYMYICIHVI